MQEYVICFKFTTKPLLRNYSEQCATFFTVLTFIFVSLSLLWKFVYDKVYKFAVQKRGLVVELAV